MARALDHCGGMNLPEQGVDLSAFGVCFCIFGELCANSFTESCKSDSLDMPGI